MKSTAELANLTEEYIAFQKHIAQFEQDNETLEQEIATCYKYLDIYPDGITSELTDDEAKRINILQHELSDARRDLEIEKANAPGMEALLKMRLLSFHKYQATIETKYGLIRIFLNADSSLGYNYLTRW